MKISSNIFKDWAVSTLLTFLLCETFWIVWLNEEWLVEGWMAGCVLDAVYCAVFSLSSILISRAFYRTAFASQLKLRNQVGFLIVILIVNMGLAYLYGQVYEMIMPSEDEMLDKQALYTFCIFATLLTLVHTTYHYCVMAIRQKDELVTMQRQVLKQGLDPHFVFNSLSSLAELTHENPAEAERYIIRLSKVYRYILSHIGQDYSTLDESIRCIEDYVALQQIRLSGEVRLQVESLGNARGEHLLPMSLQLAVENAIKHNPPTADKPLTISISRKDGWLVVKNNITISASSVSSYGIGLETLRKQCLLEKLPEPEISIENEHYEIKIPIIRQ